MSAELTIFASMCIVAAIGIALMLSMDVNEEDQ